MKDNNTVSSEQHYKRINDVAAEMGLSKRTITRWGTECNALHKLGRVVMVDMDRLNEFIGEHKR